jgi:hypothetical protein
VSEAFTINGVSLDTYAHMLTDISGIMTTPARRGENVPVPNRHGRIKTRGKRFDANEGVLPLIVVGADPVTGALPTQQEELDAFFERRDQLLNLLYADPAVMAYTRPNGHTVQAEYEVVEVVDFTRRYNEPLAKVNVAFEIPDAFWQDEDSVFENIVGTSGTEVPLTAFAGATAPISDAVITVFGPCNNPQFVHGSRWVRYNGAIEIGQQLQIDMGRWIVGPGTGTIWAPDIRNIEQGAPGPWFEIDPATVPFSVTFTHTTGGSATATISGRRKYLAP